MQSSLPTETDARRNHDVLPADVHRRLCESWWWTLRTYAKMNYLSDFYPPFARRANGEVFVLLYVRSTISRQPAGRFTPNFARGRTLVPDVSSPLLGVGGSRWAEKEANEIFVTMRVNGEF